MNLKTNYTNFNGCNDEVNAVVCGELNWISNLLKKQNKNKNAAPWIIRPVCLKYNIRGLQRSSPNVKSNTIQWGWENRNKNGTPENREKDGDRRRERQRERQREREKGAFFHVWWENTEAGNHMEWWFPGRPRPPRLSNASLERMINMLLESFPPLSKSNTYLLQHRLGHSPNQKNITSRENKIKNKTTLAFSYICVSAFIQPGYHGDRYGFF